MPNGTTPTPVVIPGWLTTRQAAERLGVDRRYISYLVRNGWLPAPTLLAGTQTRLHREDELDYYVLTHPYVGRKRVGLGRRTRLPVDPAAPQDASSDPS